MAHLATFRAVAEASHRSILVVPAKAAIIQSVGKLDLRRT
jgi:hypothetical protein